MFSVFSSFPLPRLRDLIQRRQTRSITSQLIEDCFGCLKRRVDCKSNQNCTSSFAWSTLVDRQVLSSKHGYVEVERRAELHERNGAPPAGCHVPVLQKGKQDEVAKQANFSSIAGFGDAGWFSPSASNVFLPYADLELCRQASSAGLLGRLHDRSYSRLVCKHILLREKGTASWQLGLGNVDGCIGVTWPMRDVEGGLFEVLTDQASVRSFVAILDPSRFEAMPITWISPMQRAIRRELAAVGKDGYDWHQVQLKEASHYGPLSVVAMPLGPAKDLLEVVATQGFFDLPLSYLRDLCQKLDVDIKGTSLVKVLESLVFHLVPGCTNEIFLRILDRRGLFHEQGLTYYEDMVSLDFVVDSFDKAFADQVVEAIKESKESKQTHDEFVEEVQKLKAAAPSPFSPAQVQLRRAIQVGPCGRPAPPQGLHSRCASGPNALSPTPRSLIARLDRSPRFSAGRAPQSGPVLVVSPLLMGTLLSIAPLQSQTAHACIL